MRSSALSRKRWRDVLNRNIKSVYLSGPMTGYDYYNFPAFDSAAVNLRHRYRGRGLTVFSPAEMDIDDGVVPPAKTEMRYTKKYLRFLTRDLNLISSGTVDALVMLPEWTASRGAVSEVTVALLLELPVYAYQTMEEIPRQHLKDICRSVLV